MARAEPDMSIFSAEELATMTAVLEDLRDATGTELSELSHGEPAWRLTELRETIPIQACLLVSETTITPAIAAHGAKVAAALGHR